MGKSHKPQHMGEQIRKILGDMLIKEEIKDSAFSGTMVSINAAHVTKDCSYATVYVSCLEYSSGDCAEEKRSEILEALDRSKGFIRKEISRRIKTRHVPELLFKYDASLEYGAKIDRLLDSLDIPEDDEEPGEEDFGD